MKLGPWKLETVNAAGREALIVKNIPPEGTARCYRIEVFAFDRYEEVVDGKAVSKLSLVDKDENARQIANEIEAMLNALDNKDRSA
jgi:hypothetical protein